MGECAGHWNDVRATYAALVTSSHRRRREVLRLPSGERLWCGRADERLVGGGVAPGQSPSQLTRLGGTYKKTGWYHVNYQAGSS